MKEAVRVRKWEKEKMRDSGGPLNHHHHGLAFPSSFPSSHTQVGLKCTVLPQHGRQVCTGIQHYHRAIHWKLSLYQPLLMPLMEFLQEL